MEMTVISRQLIKPSTPTPHHLRHLKLSLIDQSMIDTFAPFHQQILFFYSAQGDVHRFQNTNMSDKIKKSLSQVLTEFYPAAGEVDADNLLIHCNDRGMEYVEKRVKAPLTLAKILSSNPDVGELRRLLPDDGPFREDHSGPLLSVQVTVFDSCGGMVVAVGISHVVADGLSLAMFVKRWAAIARRDLDPNAGGLSPVIGSGASLFPPRPREMKTLDSSDLGESRPHPKLLTKRFVLDQTKINTLKASFTTQTLTTVETILALIFKCLVKMSKTSSKPIELITPISVRAQMNPPLGMHHFGNFAVPNKTVHTGRDSLIDIGVQIRKFIRKYDSDYIEKLRADDSLLLSKILEADTWSGENARTFTIASMRRSALYEADVGWGVPSWVAAFFLEGQDCVMLMDAKNGDGIEIWVTLLEDDMALFESDQQLREYSCDNPKPRNCKL